MQKNNLTEYFKQSFKDSFRRTVHKNHSLKFSSEKTLAFSLLQRNHKKQHCEESLKESSKEELKESSKESLKESSKRILTKNH